MRNKIQNLNQKKRNNFYIIFIYWSPGVTLYLLTISFVLKIFSRKKVEVIFDKTKFSKDFFMKSFWHNILFFISEIIMKIFFIKLNYTKDINTKFPIINNTENEKLDSYFLDILAYKKRKSINRMGKLSEKELILKQSYFEANKIINQLINRLDKNTSQNNIFILPGGIPSTSKLWTENIKKINNFRFYTFDVAVEGKTLWGNNGVACQYPNIIKDLDLLLDSSKEKIQKSIAISDKIISSKINCINTGDTCVSIKTIQKVPALIDPRKSQFSNDFIVSIFLNVSWDSSILGIETYKGTVIEMITKIADTLFEIEDLKIIVRQHPIERDREMNPEDNYELLDKNLKIKYGDRFKFIKATDYVNSYDLIQSSSAVIVNTSTIGLEAAILGKPVFTLSKCYYHNLGTIVYLSKIKKLKKYILDIKEKKFIINNDEKNITKVKLLHYLSQYYYKRDTGFNPRMSYKKFILLMLDWSNFRKLKKFIINYFD